MSTPEAIRTHGVVPILLFLLLNLAVAVLRLAAIPFALAVLALDGLADGAAHLLRPDTPGLDQSHRRTA